MVTTNRLITLSLCLNLMLALLFHPLCSAQERVGENWTVVRGDNSPGATYSTFVETPNGRWLAAGPSGQLMFSDNEGIDWDYGVITNDKGRPVFGTINDIVVHDNSLVATLVSFDRARGQTQGETPLPFVGRTQLLTSVDDGDSWTITDFPIPNALFGGAITGFPFPGVYLPKLFVAPNGDLLAYGTTAQSNGASAFFIGGAIFRQNGSSWEQVAFEKGWLQSMDQAQGDRLVASGFATVLESDDGGFWNGYSLVDANLNLNGQPLDFAEKELLNASDIAFVDNEYVIQTQEFRRSRNNPNIIVASNQRSVIFKSPDPFAPSRNWSGTEVPRIYPNWINMGTNIVSVVDAAFSSDTGVGWTQVDASVTPRAYSVGRVDSQGLVAVGSGDEVWTSGDAGQNWAKILDQNPGSNMSIRGRVGNILLATGTSQTSAFASLFHSLDNGTTWIEVGQLSDLVGSTSIGTLAIIDDRIFATVDANDRIVTSMDAGLTWESLSVPTISSQGLKPVSAAEGGRLIVPQATTSSEVFISDDNGQSWTSRPAPLEFGDEVKDGRYVGNGRIIYLVNSFASFDPRLLTSNDNGETWQFEDPFQEIDELDRVANDPETRVIDLRKLRQTDLGTLIITGVQGEVLVSQDRGQSWQVVLFLERVEEAFLDWSIGEVLESDGRLIVIAYRNSPVSSAFKVNFAYISEDDGASYRPVEIPTSESRVAFQSGVVGADGRMVISGNNGAVYISDPLATDRDQVQNFSVREGESLTIEVPRPPISGAISFSYQLLPDSATAGSDFVPTMGQLSWAEGETTPKPITIDTLDDPFNEGPEILRVEFGLADDLIVSFSYEITITDTELMFASPFNVLIVSDGLIRTSENGDSTTFGVVLSRNPSEDVTITLSVDIEGEITFQPASLVFTPGNWNLTQPITVTGLDDDQPDLNKTAQLLFTTASAGPEYDNLAPAIAYVINEDNEPRDTIFSSGFESL